MPTSRFGRSRISLEGPTCIAFEREVLLAAISVFGASRIQERLLDFILDSATCFMEPDGVMRTKTFMLEIGMEKGGSRKSMVIER